MLDNITCGLFGESRERPARGWGEDETMVERRGGAGRSEQTQQSGQSEKSDLSDRSGCSDESDKNEIPEYENPRTWLLMPVSGVYFRFKSGSGKFAWTALI